MNRNFRMKRWELCRPYRSAGNQLRNHKTVQKQLLRLAVILRFFLSGSWAFGAGVAAFKEQPFHADASANVVAYVTLLIDGGPSVRVDIGNRVFTTERTKLVGRVEVLSSIPLNITTESEITALRKSLADLQNFRNSFPKSAPLLDANIDALSGHIKAFDDGKVRYYGKWINKTELIEIQRSQEEVVAAAERKKLEQKIAVEKYEKIAAAESKRREEEEQLKIKKQLATKAAETEARARKERDTMTKRLAQVEEERRKFIGPRWHEYDLLVANAKSLQSKEEYLKAASVYRQALGIKSTKELERAIHECEEKTSGL